MEITIVEGDIVEQRRRRRGQRRQQRADGRRRRRRGDPARRRPGPAERPAAQLVERIGSLPTGQAAATEAGTMPARWVIHVVGPVHSRREDRTRPAGVVLPRGAARRRRARRPHGRLPGRVGRHLRLADRPTPPTSPCRPSRRHRPTSTDVRFVLFSDEALGQFQRASPSAERVPRACSAAASIGAWTCRLNRSSSPTSAPCCAATGPTTSTRCTRRSRRAATTCGRTCRGPTRPATTRRVPRRGGRAVGRRAATSLPDHETPAAASVLGGCGLHRRLGADALEIGYWLRARPTGRGS